MKGYPSFFFARRDRVVDAEEQAERRRPKALNQDHRMKAIEEQEQRHKYGTQRVEADDEYRSAYKEFMLRRRMKEEKERRMQQQSNQEQQHISLRINDPRSVTDEQDVTSRGFPNNVLGKAEDAGRYESRNTEPLPSRRTPSKILSSKADRMNQKGRSARPTRNPTYISPNGFNDKCMQPENLRFDDDVVQERPQAVVSPPWKAGEAASRKLLERNMTGPTKAQKKKKKRVTVIVEDASDNEYDNEFDSPARNRRPSPGQWMEPVEGFRA